MKLLEIILVIILPPLPVALRFGLTGKFWLNLLLSILGYLPGLIHGIYVLSKKNH
ncbi:MAG: YqaE/Pmp3 family membrane protein [Flavobacteriales bacterium]|nr:YqaE/Pmp3 family membrane protein [Flavobacteriales bacterium]